MPRQPTQLEYWDVLRQRMIAETEQFLVAGLREPYRGQVIPSFPVGRGRVPPSVASAFWRRILWPDDQLPRRAD